MNILIYCVLGFLVIGLGIILYMAWNAPFGSEEENVGFTIEKPPEK